MAGPLFIRRVALKNYKSIADCSIALQPLTFLVGPNGSGKSNFVDALRLASDALNTSLDHAIRDRGGISEVRRRSAGHPTHFAIRLEFQLQDDREGFFAFRVGAQSGGSFAVQREECRIFAPTLSEDEDAYYRVEGGEVIACSVQPAPAGLDDRLYLVNLSGTREFRLLFDELRISGFYNLNPDVIRDVQAPDAGEHLQRDGGNLASVLKQMESSAPEEKLRVEELLAKVVPGIHSMSSKSIASKETVEFRQQTQGAREPWRFFASSMSDGTLRAAAILVAFFQPGAGTVPIPLVCVEEPELALHPGAAGVLRDALQLAARHKQIIVTSHSPDLLDDKSIAPESLLAVRSDAGTTTIAVIDEVGKSLMEDGLYTAGELLRASQLTGEANGRAARLSQRELFAQGMQS